MLCRQRASMQRRSLLAGCGSALLLAGCLSDEEATESYFVVARPYDEIPDSAPTTPVDDSAVEGVIEAVVTEALDTQTTVSERLETNRERVISQIESLPAYEGDDEFMSAAYITRDETAAAVFDESHL